MNWKSFAAGVLIGVLIGFGLTLAATSRYRVTSGGPSGVMTVKLDAWTGKSWMARYYERDGGKIWYWETLEDR